MSMHQLARATYARPRAPARSSRDLEYDLLARVTQALRRAHAVRDQDFPGLARALAENLRVWSTFAADVAGSGNGLPVALRARLFYLYEFTLQHSRKVLEHSASAEVLVDINTAVMRGLRGNAGEEAS